MKREKRERERGRESEREKGEIEEWDLVYRV